MRKKYLITGFAGFVSRHFIEFLESNQVESEVLGIDIVAPEFDLSKFKHVKAGFRSANLLNYEEVFSLLDSFRPDHILHLASYSSVAFSWKNPTESFKNNTNIFLHVLEGVRNLSLKCRILSIGSSEEYGNVSETDLPLHEDHPLKPVSPYAVARVSQELLSGIYVTGYGLDIVLTRSFNHIGTYQKDVFVVSSFAKQLVAIKKKNAGGTLITGDLTITRDFIDIEDVVRAYHMLLLKGKPGSIYNVCSGTGTTLGDIVKQLCRILDLNISLETNPALIRPDDNRMIIGSNKKIKKEIGWEPQVPIGKSLEKIVNYWHENTL